MDVWRIRFLDVAADTPAESKPEGIIRFGPVLFQFLSGGILGARFRLQTFRCGHWVNELKPIRDNSRQICLKFSL
jgi:hypothetical protein